MVVVPVLIAVLAASPLSAAHDESRIGVIALDTSSGQALASYHQDDRFLMCSTFKFLAAAAVLKRVDEKKDRLDRFVRYGEADILEYAPVTKEHLAEGGMTLGALCGAAIEQSDNTAGNLLLDTVGGPSGLTRFIRSLGDEVTRVDRKEPDLNIFQAGDDRDTTSPAAMLRDMQRLLLGDILSTPSRRQLESWLQNCVTGKSLVRAAVPPNWVVGDKTGRGGNNATNDIAIIRPPGRAPILIAIYSSALPGKSEERDARIAAIAREALSH